MKRSTEACGVGCGRNCDVQPGAALPSTCSLHTAESIAVMLSEACRVQMPLPACGPPWLKAAQAPEHEYLSESSGGVKTRTRCGGVWLGLHPSARGHAAVRGPSSLAACAPYPHSVPVLDFSGSHTNNQICAVIRVLKGTAP